MAVITSAGTGNSNTGGTWTGGVVPDATSDVQILNTHTITLNTTHTWNSLDLQSGGTLDGDGNVLTIDGENAAGRAVELDGIITGTDTDITITTAAGAYVDLRPTSGNIRNLIINHSSCDIEVTSGTGETTTIAGDLTITAGKLSMDDRNENLTVTGDVLISDGGTLGFSSSAETGAFSFGSLTIASGGTYNATSGTTTLTGISGDDSAASERYCLVNGGTLTHNNGKIKTSRNGPQTIYCEVQTNFYDFEFANGAPDNNDNVYIRMDTAHYFTVYNDLTITGGQVRFYNSDRGITVHGNTHVASTGRIEMDDVSSGSGAFNFHGLYTNAGITTTCAGTNNFNGGIRNLNSFTSDDTLTIGGTGGILEGNLDEAIINVNTDAVLNFNGSDTYINAGNLTALNNTQNFTISAWIKLADTSDTRNFVFSKGPSGNNVMNIQWSDGSGGKMYWRVHDGGVASNGRSDYSPELAVGWNHIAMVFDGTFTDGDAATQNNGRLKAYVNGALQTQAFSGNMPTHSDDNSSNLYIGTDDGSNHFDGNIVDFRVYSDSLDATTIGRLSSRIGIDNGVVQATDTRVAHYMLTVKHSGSLLDEDVDSGAQVEIDVDDGDDFTTDGEQHILVGDEVMVISSISTDTLTVAARSGANLCGTTAATHDEDDPIYIIGLEDLSTNNNALTLVGDLTTPSGDLVFDAFSVNVQGAVAGHTASTTTDGAVTVTQGKLECKALTSLCGDGTNDRAYTVDSADFDFGTGDFTMSMWVSPDDLTWNWAAGRQNAAADEDVWRFGTESNGYVAFRDIAGADNAYGSTALTVDKWNHITAVRDSGTLTVYLNGVADGSVASSGNLDSDKGISIGSSGHYTSTDTFDGHWRDYKIYDYALSTDQVASLYSGSYNVTPLHWWKFDDSIVGTIVNEPVDSGTGTALNLVTTGFYKYTGIYAESASSNWSNDNIDLDGALTIAANGTLSAPRGNLLCSGYFVDLGTFTHNSGTVEFDNSANNYINNDDNASVTAFHNVTHSGAARQRYSNSVIIENTLDINNGVTQSDGSRTGKSFTFGTATQAGSIDLASGKALRPNPSAISGGVTWQGASSLYPCVVTGDDWSWSDGAQETKLANMDFQMNIDTSTFGSDNCTLTLTGDCEFDAVTVSSGDTLDLNGQRMEVSGTLTNSGTIDYDGLIVTSGTFNDDGTVNNIASCDIIMTAAQTDVDSPMTTSPTVLPRTLMINTGTGTTTTLNGRVGTNTIVASGELQQSHDDTYATPTNVTIATGAELDGDSKTLTVAGDFTTSGGLLGASAFYTSGDDSVINSSIDLSGKANLSVEFWMKSAYAFSSGALEVVVGQFNDWDNVALIGFETDGNISFNNRKGGVNDRYMAQVDVKTDHANKWVHVAYTYEGSSSTYKCYINGKLEAQSTGSNSTLGSSLDDYAFTVGTLTGASRPLSDSVIDELRIFDDVRTEAEIRTDMFQGGTLDDSGNLILRWSFDEGTSTSVTDSSSNSFAGTLSSASWAGAGTFTDTSGTSTLKMTGSSKNINYTGDETIGHLHIDAGETTLNNLSVTDGTDTFTCSSVTIDGGTTFTSTAGTLAITSETSAYALNNSGTFTHNNGTVKTTYDGDTILRVNTLYNVEVAQNDVNDETLWDCASGTDFVILGDLTVTMGKWDTRDVENTITVHGLTNITANGKHGTNGTATGAHTHHGLVTNLGTYEIKDGVTVKMNGGIRQLGTLTIS